MYVVSQALMTSVTGLHFHCGALASAERPPHPDLATVVSGADLLVMAEGVSDNENLVALFGNAAAFGVGGVVLDAISADPLYRRSVRVSIGKDRQEGEERRRHPAQPGGPPLVVGHVYRGRAVDEGEYKCRGRIEQHIGAACRPAA